MRKLILIFLIFIPLFFLQQKDHFIPGDVNMAIPQGQLVSPIPLSRNCLLALYENNYEKYKEKPKNTIHLPVQNYKDNASRCDNLAVRECLATPTCGWLSERNGKNGRCLRGTPIGPLNPKHLQHAEDTHRANVTLDVWKYSHVNPWATNKLPNV